MQIEHYTGEPGEMRLYEWKLGDPVPEFPGTDSGTNFLIGARGDEFRFLLACMDRVHRAYEKFRIAILKGEF